MATTTEDVESILRVTAKGLDFKPVNRSPRRFWRPLLILMLLVEWAVDLVREIVTVAHNSIKVLTLTLKSYLDEPTGPKPSA